jgi:hypothetical protein
MRSKLVPATHGLELRGGDDATVTPWLSRLSREKGSPDFDLPRVLDRNVQPGPSTRQKPFESIVSAKPQGELVARHARLRHAHNGGTDAQPVTETHGGFEHPFRREVFAEHPPG